MAELKVISGPTPGKLFKVGNGISTIGREQTNSVRINDYEISRRHAELHIHDNECLLVDLGSSNGTLVNDEPVSNRYLASGDQIRIGQTVLEFQSQQFMHAMGNQSDTVRETDDESAAIEGTVSSPGSSNQLLQTQSNLEVLYHAALAAGSYQSTESLLQRILDLVFCWISAHRSCILLREDDRESLISKSIDAQTTDKYSTEPFDFEHAVIKYVFRHKEGIVVNDIQNDDRFPFVLGREVLKDRQIICAPIKSRYGIRGVIYADKSRCTQTEGGSNGPFDEQQLKLLHAIGLHAAVAIENADHYAMLLQSERVTAVGNAMASMSHHIKNILQSINGGNHLIEEGLSHAKIDLIQNGWKIVQKNQQNLGNLVMDMLSYSNNSTPRLESSNLIEMVEGVVSSLQCTAKNENVELSFESDEKQLYIAAESDLMRRAIYNVIDFSINSCRDSTGGKVEVLLQSSGTTAELSISDCGINFSKEELSRIFDPLAHSERSARFGLGMAVARKIFIDMAGSIEAVQDKDFFGNRFVIKLPMVNAPEFHGSGTGQAPAS